jgi:hypothetical protein
MKNETWTGLYRPAHRTNPFGNKIIKDSRKRTQRLQSKKSNCPATQCPEPVQLPGTANAFKPSVLGDLEQNAASNSLYSSLKSWEKSFGTQSDNCAADRTSVPFEPNSLGNPIKIRQHMAVPPDLGGIAFWADFGSLPRIALLFFRIFLRLMEVRIIIFSAFLLIGGERFLAKGLTAFLHKKKAPQPALFISIILPSCQII